MEENNCPKCGHWHTVRCGFNVTKKGRFQRRQCMQCGSTFYEKGKEEPNKNRGGK